MQASGNLKRLDEYLSARAGRGLCIAFSGGVDSALLLACAAKAGGKVVAVTLHSPLHSPGEPGEAAGLAKSLGVKHRVISIDGIPDGILDNPPNRCYLCKKELFVKIFDLAESEGLGYVMDGTNGDDLNVYRPGRWALKELGVLSPLAELGLTKAQVRAMAESLGLKVASKPSAPCLATRFPYGARLSEENMAKAEKLESTIKEMGIPVVRARIYGETVRLEVLPENFEKILTAREKLTDIAKSLGFLYTTLDIEGFRTGSMDLAIDTSEQ